VTALDGGLVVRFASSSRRVLDGGLVVRFASSSRRVRLVAGASLAALPHPGSDQQ